MQHRIEEILEIKAMKVSKEQVTPRGSCWAVFMKDVGWLRVRVEREEGEVLAVRSLDYGSFLRVRRDQL